MTGMEAVLAAHGAMASTSDFLAGTHVTCMCDWTYRTHSDHAAHVAEALTAAGFGSQHDAWADTISRVEVIDDTGRAYTKYTPAGTVSIDRQDQGRTLKVFITEGATK